MARRSGVPLESHWWELSAFGFLQATLLFNVAVLFLATPGAGRTLNLTATNEQWLLGGFVLAVGGFLLAGARVGASWGRRRTMASALGLWIIGSILSAFAQDFVALLVGVVLIGVATAFLVPAVLYRCARFSSDPSERSNALAMYGIVSACGIVTGFFLASVVLEWTSWRECFSLEIVLAIIAIVGVAEFVTPDRWGKEFPRALREDVLATISAVLILVALVQVVRSPAALFGGLGNMWSINATTHWLSPWVLAPLAVGLVVSAYVLSIDREMPTWRSVWKSRNLIASMKALIVPTAVVAPILALLANYLKDDLGSSPVGMGFQLLPLVVTGFVTAGFASGHLYPTTGPRSLIPSGFVVMGMGIVLFTRLTPFADYWGHVFPGLLLIGAGLGLVVSPALASSLTLLGRTNEASTTAHLALSHIVAAIGGLAVLGSIDVVVAQRSYRAHEGDGLFTPNSAIAHGLAVACWWSAGVCVLALLVTFVMLRSGSPVDPDDVVPQMSGQG